MAYSHSRLRKSLAVIRILTGALLLGGGLYKLLSPDFAPIEFPHEVLSYLNGQVVAFYPTGAFELVWRHASSFATAMGVIETVLGGALLLGLAVRPAALLGSIYFLNFLLVSWHQTEAFATDLQQQWGRLFLVFLFGLFAVGHAGETWGAGSLYHAGRARLLRAEPLSPHGSPAASESESPVEEPGLPSRS